MSGNWEETTLDEAVTFKGGGTPSKDNSAYWSGDIPWVSPKDMKSSTINNSIDKITTEAVENSAASLIPRNSILVVVRSGILARTIPVAITSCDLAVNQDLKALYPKPDVDARFLHYFMQMAEPQILKLVTRGATVHRLSTESLKSLRFPKPPLAEQQRIVAILDETFAGLATATANAEKNLKNARELFESCLDEALANEEWSRRTLYEIAAPDCSLSYGIVQPGNEVSDGLPVVRPVDLGAELVRVGGLKRIDPVRAQGYSRTRLKGGELLLCVRGTTGSISIASEELAGGNVTRGIVPIRFDPSQMIQRFGYYALLSKTVQRQIGAKTYGAALMQINIRDLRNLSVPVPPLPEQEKVATRLEGLGRQTSRLIEINESRLVQLKTLKEALLQRAFSGELTAPPTEAINEAAE
ncbi:MAG: restriction endonuclease subunit S [Methyloligella sp. ZOD6]